MRRREKQRQTVEAGVLDKRGHCMCPEWLIEINGVLLASRVWWPIKGETNSIPVMSRGWGVLQKMDKDKETPSWCPRFIFLISVGIVFIPLPNDIYCFCTQGQNKPPTPCWYSPQKNVKFSELYISIGQKLIRDYLF